jgi:hypothetical protein
MAVATTNIPQPRALRSIVRPQQAVPASGGADWAPADAHHLRFAQPRALGRKPSDEFTVPLCRAHHRDLRSVGDEVAWWARINVDPSPVAQRLWTRADHDET